MSTSASLTILKPLTVWITTNCGKFWKRWEYQTTQPACWDICMQVKKQQLELNTEQQTGSKLGKEYVKAVYCHPAYLMYIQSTSCDMPGWMKHKLQSTLPWKISTTVDMEMIPLWWPKERQCQRTVKLPHNCTHLIVQFNRALNYLYQIAHS